MVGLRKFFNTTEKNASRSTSTATFRSPSPLHCIDDANNYNLNSTNTSPMGVTPGRLPEPNNDTLPSVNRHFHGIEKQFEQLHEHFHSYPFSLFQFKYGSPNSTKSPAPRHVDVLETLFSSYRYRISSRSLSPTSPYNEDIADRNLSTTIPTKPMRNARVPYARIVSTIYQEDVADRNIASSGGNAWYPESRISPTGPSRSKAGRVIPIKLRTGNSHSTVLVSVSHEDLRCLSGSTQSKSALQSSYEAETISRPQTAAPDLLVEQGSSLRDATALDPSRHLNHARLPEGERGPRNLSSDSTEDSKQKINRATNAAIPSLRGSLKGFGSLDSPHLVSRRNVRDLSINTQLASLARPGIKIDHSSTQSPTPSHLLTAPNPSVTEIVNSPLPTATPTGISPQPTPTSNFEEIMSVLKHACLSTRTTSSNPTFETLQDAIVREINSHDAFRQVPVPETGPPFTPPASQESFDLEPDLQMSSKALSEKENQLAKLIRKGSMVRKRGKSISSANNLKGDDKMPRHGSEFLGLKRRHTYAQPPSADWVDAEQPTGPAMSRLLADFPGGFDQRYFADSHLKRKSDPVLSSPVYHMQAIKSGFGIEAAVDIVGDYDEDEITQLPQMGAPTVQIKAVDDNNVTYILNATEPLTPQELMSISSKISKKSGIIDRLGEGRSRSSSPFKMGKKRMPLRRSSLNKESPGSYHQHGI